MVNTAGFGDVYHLKILSLYIRNLFQGLESIFCELYNDIQRYKNLWKFEKIESQKPNDLANAARLRVPFSSDTIVARGRRNINDER